MAAWHVTAPVRQQQLRRLFLTTSAAALALGGSGARAADIVRTGSTQTGSTQTSIGGTATDATISTATISGATGFNSFSSFNLVKGQSATLMLPANTTNLVNLVGSKMSIDGTITSKFSASNAVGGNLFFVTPSGLVLGVNGQINTGRLIVRGGPIDHDITSYTPSYVTGASGTALVQLDGGSIVAPGGIDIKADVVSAGATAKLLTGAAGFNQQISDQTAALVSTAGLVEGAAMVAINGGIKIVGKTSVKLTAGSLLDARPGSFTAPGTTTPFSVTGGIGIATGGTATLGGTLTAWNNLKASTAADITVTASAASVADASFASKSLADYTAASTVATALTIGGTVTGGNVTLTSSASATTATSFVPLATTVQLLRTANPTGINALIGTAGTAENAFYTHVDATTGVSIDATANVTAQTDLKIVAASIATAASSTNAAVTGDKTNISIAVGYSELKSKATVDVATGGKLAASGILSINASNDASSDLRIEAVSNPKAVAAALALTSAAVDADITLAAGTTLTANTVDVKALNFQSAADKGFKNVGITLSKDDSSGTSGTSGTSAGGGGGAISNLNLNAKVAAAGTITTPDGTISSTGAVTIDATTKTNLNINWAGTDHGAGTLTDIKPLDAAGGTDLKGLLAFDFDGNFKNVVEGLFGGSDVSPDPNVLKQKGKSFGAVDAMLFNTQTANVDVGGSVTGGVVKVDALVHDEALRNAAKATVAAKSKDDTDKASLAGAGAYDQTTYTSHATVGGTVTSTSLAVDATSERPRGAISYDFTVATPTDKDGNTLRSDVTAFADDLLAKATDKLKVGPGLFSSSAGATASTDGQNAASSATVSYEKIGVDTRAWIAPSAVLTLSGPLSVQANTDMVAMNLAGALPVSGTTFAVSGGASASGIAIGYADFTPNTVAGIGEGVTVDRSLATSGGTVKVDAIDTTVTAATTISSYTLAPQGGESSTKTGAGTYATNAADGTTHATISKDARLDLGSGQLTLGATTSLELWAVGGSVAVTKADGTGDSGTAKSVGVSGAINLADMGTRALVGDATDDDDAGVHTAAANAAITAGNVDATATATGSINAIAVAGSVTTTTATTTDPKPAVTDANATDKSDPGTLDKVKTKLDTSTTKIATIKAKYDAEGKYASYTDAYTSGLESPDATTKQNKQDQVAKGVPITKTWGVAGSASVDLSTLTTTVELTNAKFTRAAAMITATHLLALASEGVDLLSVSGGATITKGKSTKTNNTLIAGALGLSSTENQTGAKVTSSSITDFTNVDIQGAANGTRIGAALALAADTTTSTDGKTVAGAASVLLAHDSASATATDSKITGSDSANGGLGLLAYDGLTMGAGAGGLSWGSSNAVGGAVTLVDITSPAGGAASALLTRTPVSGFKTLSVRALDAARVAGIAAAAAVTNGAGTQDRTALSAALSLNLVTIDSTATVDVGNAGQGTIDVTGAVSVFSGDRPTDTVDAAVTTLAAKGKNSSTAGASMIGNFAIQSSDFPADDPVTVDQLASGTQILSIAVPIAKARGKAIGVGIAWNEVTNYRSAGIIGNGSSATQQTVKAASLSVQAVDLSAILALGVGIGASSNGASLIGSISRNLIGSTASAGIIRTDSAKSNIGIDITGTPGATPNVSIGALGKGGIFSLAGAIAAGKGNAGGLAVGVNDIVRASTGSKAGLDAGLDGVTFSGSSDTAVTATSSGSIFGIAFAGAASTDNLAVGAAASANMLAPTIAAHAAHLDYSALTPGDLKISASDDSTIKSIAVGAAASSDGSGAGASVGADLIDAQVSAALAVTDANTSILVRNLVVESWSHADTAALGVGISVGTRFAGAGSVSVNKTTTDVSSLLTLSNGAVNVTGSVGVLAQRDSSLSVLAGAVAASSSSAAGGASVVVNEVGGSATAKIAGTPDHGTLTASNTASGSTGSAAATDRQVSGIKITALRTGDLTANLKQFDAVSTAGTDLAKSIASATGAFQGVVVNASSTTATRTLAITGAFSSKVGVAATAVVGSIGGTTDASITDADIKVGITNGAADNGIGVDVRASNQALNATFAGAVAAAGNVALAAPVASDAFKATTSATITRGKIDTTGTVKVNAQANQSAADLAVSAALGGSVAVAVAGVSPRFQTTTKALIDSPLVLSAKGADGVTIAAQSSARAEAAFGALAGAGSGAAAGAVVVAINDNDTEATYRGKLDAATGLGSVTVAAPKVTINANGDFDADVSGASVAVSAGVSLVGNGVGVVHRGTVLASADGLTYDSSDGAVSVKAGESVAVKTIVGQVAIAASPTGAAAAVGVIAVLSQSKIGAELLRPSITAKSVDVEAVGYNRVDANQLGLAIGGVAVGANVTYIAVGDVVDNGALYAAPNASDSDKQVAANSGSYTDTKDGKTKNKNLQQLSAGGDVSAVSAAAAGTSGGLSSDEIKTVGTDTASRSAFADVGQTSDPKASAAAGSHVSAEILDTLRSGATASAPGSASVKTDTLTINSAANLLSRSRNVNVAAGLAAGGGTVAITRNAAQGIATLGNVNASGITPGISTATIKATTGQDKADPTAPAVLGDITDAARAEIYAASLGIIALSVGVADVRLQSEARASSVGQLNFGSADIHAVDTTSASVRVIGVAAGGGVLNIAVGTAKKDGTTVAEFGGGSTSNSLTVEAEGLGSTTSEAYAGAGGLFGAGNAAVAIADDKRTVTATIDENSQILAVKATNVQATMTPLVSATTYGVAVAGGVAAGASVATATAEGLVGAYVGEGTNFCPLNICGAGMVTVKAEAAKPIDGINVNASATGSAGGALAALNGASAIASTTLTTEAVVGKDFVSASSTPVILAPAMLDIEANRTISQYSVSSGVTVAGLLAIGVQRAEATSGGTTTATLGNVDGSNRGQANASVLATSLDTNYAKVTAGAGGLGAGVAALATTTTDGTTEADATPPSGKTFSAGTLTVKASAGADYRADSDSTLATAVGGSGTTSDNTVDTHAVVNIGTTTLINGTGSRFEVGPVAASATDPNIKEFDIAALNTVGKNDSNGGRARGAGGGVLAGAAALVTDTVDQSAAVNILAATTLRQYGGDISNNSRATFIDAAVVTNRDQSVALEIGGAMSLPFARINGTYRPTTAITIGAGALLRGDQGIGIGTHVNQNITDTAGAQIYGLASLGGASTDSSSTVTQTITVADNATIESMMDIRISAGTGADGIASDQISLATQTDTFNWTIVPLSTEANSNTTIVVDNQLDLRAATIRSARDLTISAEASPTHASASGEGHNPYLKLFSLTTGSGNTHGASTGTIGLDGTTLTAGFLNQRGVTVNKDGSISSTDFGVISQAIGADGKWIAGNASFGHTMLNNRVSTGPQYDDRLGTYLLTTGTASVDTSLADQLTALVAALPGGKLPAELVPAHGQPYVTSTAAWLAAINSSDKYAQIATLIETRQALLQAPRGSAPDAVIVGAVSLDSKLPGGLFAASGVIALNTTNFTTTDRAATVNANGGAVITIANTSDYGLGARDTELGDILIPFKTGGFVKFTGAATALPASVTAPVAPGNGDGSINIVSGFDQNSPRADIIEAGRIDNLGGLFKAVVNNGNYVQFGQVNVASFSAAAPNGLFLALEPAGTNFGLGLPVAYYYGNYGFALYDGGNNGVCDTSGKCGTNAPLTADDVINKVASAIAMQRWGIANQQGGAAALDTAAKSGDALTSTFLDRNHTSGVSGDQIVASGNSSIIFGSCASDCKYAGPGFFFDNLGRNSVNLGFTTAHIYSNGTFLAPTVDFSSPVFVANLCVAGANCDASNEFRSKTYPAGADIATTNSITANQVIINAKYVNISGTITAGPVKERSLIISDQVQQQQRFGISGASMKLDLALAQATSAIVDLTKGLDVPGSLFGTTSFLPAATNNADTSIIGATFTRTGTGAAGNALGYITVDNVGAGIGGSITITGKILNTNPLGGGKLIVRDGFANISVVNNSDYEVRLGVLNAGLSVDGKITLRDKAADGITPMTTVYVDAPGQGLTKSYNGGAAVLQDKGVGTTSPITYNLPGDFVYAWTDSRTYNRNVDTSSVAENAQVTPWKSDTGTASKAGDYHNLNDTNDKLSTMINTARGTSNDNFVQVLTASVNRVSTNGADFSSGNHYDFILPDQITATVTTAVKATYPISLQFSQITGGINVTSNNGGKITLTGGLTFGGGSVNLSTNSSIDETADALVTANSLNLTAGGAIGASLPFTAAIAGSSLVSSTGPVVNGVVNATAGSTIDLKLSALGSSNGNGSAVGIGQISAPGNVHIASDTALIGVNYGDNGTANIHSDTRIDIATAGAVIGSGSDADGYTGALLARGLVIDLPNEGRLKIVADGDVRIQTATSGGVPDPTRVLKIESIVTPGDVLIRAQGSVVAADATATVDQAKLDRFTAAAKALQLAPVAPCTIGCVVDPQTTIAADADIRSLGLAAYLVYQDPHATPAAAAAAIAQLTMLFGGVPANQQSIATIPINKNARIDYTLRNQGRAAYDTYALTDVAPTAATMAQQRTQAVAGALGNVEQIAAFAAKPGITVSADGRILTLDFSTASLKVGGELYKLALAVDRSTPKADGSLDPVPLPTNSDITHGLNLYLASLRDPLTKLLPDALPPLPVLGADMDKTAQLAALSAAITDGALGNWATAMHATQQRAQASADALGKIQQIAAFGAKPGITVSADGRTLAVDFTKSTVQPGGELYDLALALDRSTLAADGSRDTVPLPTNADITHGLTLYLASLRDPLTQLLPNVLPVLASLGVNADPTAQLKTVSDAISTTALSNWAAGLHSDAVATLDSLFTLVPVSRDAIATLDINDTIARHTQSTWSQTMLDVAVPSTAFVPVADTQFETRAPVITARSVSIVAGNSIGSFDVAKSYSFDAKGFVGSSADKQLALAYLASAGPGDLTTKLTTVGNTVVEATFTTRRDQPFQLAATGIVNAVAAANLYTLAPTANTLTSPVQGNIFLTNSGALNLGTVISEKGRAGGENAGCASGNSPSAAVCDSRIRIVASDLQGTSSGAATVYEHIGPTAGTLLSDADGRALVMGGLVRLEASSGAIRIVDPTATSGTAILIDAHAVEVLRAAGDITIWRRTPTTILQATPQAGGVATDFSFGRDLTVGDVFAGGTLTLDNPAGSFFVAQLPSPLASENRNSRIVAGVLSIRAAGDIGAASDGVTGLIGQFDVQAPLVDQFVAGYDYGLKAIGVGPQPVGLPAGDAFLALRGPVQIGCPKGATAFCIGKRSGTSSVLGARRDINIGYFDDTKFKLTIASDIYMGGLLSIIVKGSNTDGSINFLPDVRITAPGNTTRDGSLDLSRLSLYLTGTFNLTNDKSILINSLSAGGGTITSNFGKIIVGGTLFGLGGPTSPFALDAYSDISVGGVAGSTISLNSRHGTAAITTLARATDLTVTGDDIAIDASVYGRTATLTTNSPSGTLALGGPIILNRVAGDLLPASLVVKAAGAVKIANLIEADDKIDINAASITTGSNAALVNTTLLNLTAATIAFDRATLISGIGTMNLAVTGTDTGNLVALTDISGGTLKVTTPGSLVVNRLRLSGDATLMPARTLTLNNGVAAAGNVTLTAAEIDFGTSGSVSRSGNLTVTSPRIITAARTALTTSGALKIVTNDQIALYSLTSSSGRIDVATGGFMVTGGTTITGSGFAVAAKGDVSLVGTTTLAGGLDLGSSGGAVKLAGLFTLQNSASADPLTVRAFSTASLAASSRITGTARSNIIVDAAVINFDPTSIIADSAVTLRSKGMLTTGDMLANTLQGQSLTLRSAGTTSIGALSGTAVTLSNTIGSLTLRKQVQATTLTVSTPGQLTTNGIAAARATLSSSGAGVVLNGITRVSGATTGTNLIASAATALTINGATSAAAGVQLSAASITTTPKGYITDADGQGALQVLAADSINVRFNTGMLAGATPLRVAASGLTSSAVQDGIFAFQTLRPVTFAVLNTYRSTITAQTALSINSLTLRDWLLVNSGTSSIALQAAAAPPGIPGRTIATGKLTTAKLVVTPAVATGKIGVQLNGGTR